ncbi:MAG: DeoR/GlpR family DNA-binding transcription regulator [Clostridia bacterium]|nr:DeoR/GlpR family DNA-binding transcription regulator [Clostridia bacterium]
MKRERVEEIADILDKRGKMTLEQLEEAFPNVSQMTLRRDLFQLEEDGRIIRVRGGAMSVKEVQKVSGEAYIKKTTINTDAKLVIAQKAATLIDEGSSIFLDGGTTAMYLAKELSDMKCNIFTNGIAVAMELAQKKNLNVTVVGGQLMRENLSTASPAAKEYFERTNFEIAIVSATAFTPENGFSCNSQIESDLLKQVFGKARQVFMMLDTSKIGKINPYTFAHIEDIDVLITDDNLPREYKNLFEDKNIVVM